MSHRAVEQLLAEDGGQRLIVVVGYCGAGKSTLFKSIQERRPSLATMDEGFAEPRNERDFRERYGLVGALCEGRSCVVGDANYRMRWRRELLIIELGVIAPSAAVRWVFFENNRAGADENCRRRGGDVEGYLRLNALFEAGYDMPHDAVVLPIVGADRVR
jgi:hypothetical protein